MIADRYTKVVLTIIAFTLVIIAAENAVQPSRAYGDLQKVQICDEKGFCAGLGISWEGGNAAGYALNVVTHSPD